MSNLNPDTELRAAISDAIVMAALRIKTGAVPITPSTFPDHVEAGKAILAKHHEGLNNVMHIFQARQNNLIEAGLRENILRVYATMQDRTYEDVRREYLGIAPPGSDKYAIASNKLHNTVESAIARSLNQYKTEGGES